MNSGTANKAAIRLPLWSMVPLAGFLLAAWIGYPRDGVILAFHTAHIVLGAVLLVAVLYFFRDPDPILPAPDRAVGSPAHGKVDVIENAVESEFMHLGMKRPARRVDLYLPSAVKLDVNAGDELVGGQSVVAGFE
jgi:phosphatidylserine decarboxylase